MKKTTNVLTLLSDQKGLSENLILKIIQLSLDEKKSQIKKALKKLKSAKAIKKEDELIKITGNGLKRLPRNKGKLMYNLPYWLKSWMMFIFEIPESEKNKRDKLRYRLKKHGFGMIQSSIWISPRELPKSLNEFISENNLNSKIQTLSFSVGKDDISELVSRAWQINKLNEEYRQYVEEGKERFNLVKNYSWEDKRVKKKALKMLAYNFKEKYHKLRSNDPELPKVVLPSDWQGFRAHHIYEQLFKYL